MRTWLAFLVLIGLFCLGCCCWGWDSHVPYVEGTRAASIYEAKASVPVIAIDSAVGRLEFSDVDWNYKETSKDSRMIKVWADVQRKQSKDENKVFKVRVALWEDNKEQGQFEGTIVSSMLSLNDLAEMPGGVPERLTVTILEERE